MENLPIRIIGFLVDDNRVLLGQKKEGMGEGNFIGIGGKPESGETSAQTLLREIEEEIQVIPLEYQEMGSVKFVFPHKPSWSQEIIPFLITKWNGIPVETDEIKPQWFDKNDLPLSQMWPDSKYWIPDLLKGSKISKIITYANDDSVDRVENKNLETV
jgi:8-oxo-dGTP diphosphatase